MPKGASTVIELRTAVATLKRAQDSMKRRHREQAKLWDELSARVDLLEYARASPPRPGETITHNTFLGAEPLCQCPFCVEHRDTNPLPKTESDVTPPRAADSGAPRDSSRRSLFDWITGRKAT